jgi:hypothetical protein
VKKTRCAPVFLRCCLLLLGATQIAALLVAWERPALAYIDPGSGFVFLQVAGSMVAGAAYYLRHRVKRLFGSSRETPELSAPVSGVSEVAENQP